jgi:hypothetical protein|tara:strand:- start:4336 stop:4590 length:255 start_codon:yes stop_codon:yes gene_type:complete
MRFPLLQLYKLNRSKPLVQVGESDKWVQWNYCDLEGLPPERLPGSMTDHGKIPQGQYDNLPDKFTAMDGKEYMIARIHTLKSSI